MSFPVSTRMTLLSSVLRPVTRNFTVSRLVILSLLEVPESKSLTPFPSCNKSGATDVVGGVRSIVTSIVPLLSETLPALSPTVYQKVYTSSDSDSELGI